MRRIDAAHGRWLGDAYENGIAVSTGWVHTGSTPLFRASVEELSVFRNNLDQAHFILCAAELPQGRAHLAIEMIKASFAITDDLLSRKPVMAPRSPGGLGTSNLEPEDSKGSPPSAEIGPEDVNRPQGGAFGFIPLLRWA